MGGVGSRLCPDLPHDDTVLDRSWRFDPFAPNDLSYISDSLDRDVCTNKERQGDHSCGLVTPDNDICVCTVRRDGRIYKLLPVG